LYIHRNRRFNVVWFSIIGSSVLGGCSFMLASKICNDPSGRYEE